MLVSLVPIGNSKGIRLPKNILEECEITDKLELTVKNNEVILRPVKSKTREKWDEKFKLMRGNGDDELVMEVSSDFDMAEWDW